MARSRRKKNVRKKKKDFKLSPKAIWIVLAVLVFSGAVFFLARTLYYSDFFIVKEVKSNTKISSSLIKSIEGKSLFSLDTGEIYRRVLKNNPEYKKVFVLKEFPSALRIDVLEREAFAQIKGERFYPIDREGVILAEGSRKPLESLIQIEVSDNITGFEKGKSVKSEGLHLSLALLEVLKRKDILDDFDVSLINARLPQALYFLIDKTKIIVGKGNYDHKIFLFKNVLSDKLNNKVSLVKYVDLRYKKVYLGYKR